MAAADALDEIRHRNARINRNEKDGLDYADAVVRPQDEALARPQVIGRPEPVLGDDGLLRHPILLGDPEQRGAGCDLDRQAGDIGPRRRRRR